MSNNSSNLPSGYIPITTSSLEPGAGNPRESALIAGQNANAKLASLNSSVGGKRKKYKGGANNEIPAPQFPMQYTPTGGPGTSPNNQIADITTNSMQSNAWNVNDSQATKMGGKKKYRKGGSSDWLWGCYSGGKKTKRQRTRKSRKYRKKSRRQRRH